MVGAAELCQEVRMEQADFVVRGSSLPWLVLRCGTVSKPRKYAADGGGGSTHPAIMLNNYLPTQSHI
jgi:hypothetical protein